MSSLTENLWNIGDKYKIVDNSVVRVGTIIATDEDGWYYVEWDDGEFTLEEKIVPAGGERVEVLQMSYNPIKVALARAILKPPKWVKLPSRDKDQLGKGSHTLREGWVLKAFYGDNGLEFCTIIVELDPDPGQYIFKADFGAVGRSMAGNDLDDLKQRCEDMWYEEMSYMLSGDPVEEISDIDDLDDTNDDDEGDVYVSMEEEDEHTSMLVIALPRPLPTLAQSPRLANIIAQAVHDVITNGQAAAGKIAAEEADEGNRQGQAPMFDLMGQADGNLRSWRGRFGGSFEDEGQQIQNEARDHWERQTGGGDVSSEDYDGRESPFADLMKKWTHRDPDEWLRQTHGDFEKLDSGN